MFWRGSSERCSAEGKKVAHHVRESWQTPWDAGNESTERSQSCREAELLPSAQIKPSMAERPGERIATTFLTDMVRDMSTYQQKVHPASRAWVDNSNGKGGLPAWVMFRWMYRGRWAGIKMEGCKHPLISCRAPTDITVMTAQRSGPKYGLFCSTEYGFFFLFIICCLQSSLVWKSVFNDSEHLPFCFLLNFFSAHFFSPPLLLSCISPPFPEVFHPLISGIVSVSDVLISQQLTCLKAMCRCSSSPLLSPSQALRVIEWWFGDISRKCLCVSTPMIAFWGFSVPFLWGIEPHTLFFTCNLLLGTVGTGCMSQLWSPIARGRQVSAAASCMAQKLVLCKALGSGLEGKRLFCRETKAWMFVSLVPNAQKLWSRILFLFPGRASSSWLKNCGFRKKKYYRSVLFLLWLLKAEHFLPTDGLDSHLCFEKKTEIVRCHIILALDL